MKDKILRALQFLRLVDEQNNLSLTNLALIASVASLIARPEIGVTDATTIVASLLGYQFKKYLTNSGTTETSNEDIAELKKTVESLQSKVTGVVLGNSRK
jgi:hypothetical protein